MLGGSKMLVGPRTIRGSRALTTSFMGVFASVLYGAAVATLSGIFLQVVVLFSPSLEF